MGEKGEGKGKNWKITGKGKWRKYCVKRGRGGKIIREKKMGSYDTVVRLK